VESENKTQVCSRLTITQLKLPVLENKVKRNKNKIEVMYTTFFKSKEGQKKKE
jgi:hypothetical protein